MRPSRGFTLVELMVALALALAVGGILADLNWRLLFWGDGVTTLAFGALAFALVKESKAAPTPGAAPEPAGESPWRDGVFVKLVTSSFIFSVAFFMDLIVLPLTVTGSAGYPARVYGFLIATNGFLIAVLELTLFEVKAELDAAIARRRAALEDG